MPANCSPITVIVTRPSVGQSFVRGPGVQMRHQLRPEIRIREVPRTTEPWVAAKESQAKRSHHTVINASLNAMNDGWYGMAERVAARDGLHRLANADVHSEQEPLSLAGLSAAQNGIGRGALAHVADSGPVVIGHADLRKVISKVLQRKGSCCDPSRLLQEARRRKLHTSPSKAMSSEPVVLL